VAGQQTQGSPQPPATGLSDRRVQIFVALIAAGASIICSTITGVVTWYATRDGSSNHSASADAVPFLGPINEPGSDGVIGEVVALSGTVYNLKPGQMVWTFNEPTAQQPGAGSIYADSGPCTVSGNTWSCNDIYIGESPTIADPKLGQGSYIILAAIISDQDAFTLVNDLRCHTTPTNPCPGLTTVPGTDISKPQQITVYRNH
jgi:hypothetical protein